MLYIPLCMS